MKYSTDFEVKKLKPRTTQYEVADAKYPGLAVRVSPGGRKSFTMMYRLNGIKARLTLGAYPRLALAEARKQAAIANASLAKGIDPRTERKKSAPANGGQSLAYFAELYIQKYAKKHTRSWSETQRILLKQVTPKIGKTPIDQVERRKLIDLLSDLEESNGPSAARHAFFMIRQLFNWCIQQDYIQHSPCAGMKAPGKVKPRERVLSRAELVQIWRAADEMSYPMAQYVKLLALTGQRRSEVAKMRWTDIDFEQKQWIQPSSANKSARPHVVPLADGVIDIFMTLPRFEGEYVFPAKGRSNRAISGFSKWKKELDRRSGINDWVLHDFRRTVATELAKAGHAIHVVELVLNHSSQKLGGVAGIYNRYQYETEKARALQDWASRVNKLVLNAK